MKTAPIPHVSLDERVLQNQTELRELASEATRLLGYTRMRLDINAPYKLYETLRSLEIDPLESKSVKAYKAKKAKPSMWSGHKEAWTKSLPVTILCIVASVALWIKFCYTPATSFACVPLIIFGIITTVASVLFAGCTANLFFNASRDWRGHRMIRSWTRVSIGDYTEPIPPFILNKACQIKKQLPAAGIYVEYLTESREEGSRNIRLLRDPFLIAKDNNEEYYIDVWDEYEYEQAV